jgi:hypothetical protein
MTDSKSPFRPSFLKIERAKSHIQELEQVVAEWFKSEPVTFRTTPRPHKPVAMPPDAPEKLRGMQLFEMAFDMEWQNQPAPEVTAAILGDIFHNLRSALDLMACELARKNSGSDDEVYFPFAINAAELDRIIEKRFGKAGPAAVKLLRETIKPYRGGNDMLRAIHDLNVQDKHRMLILQQISFSGPIIDLGAKGGESVFASDPNKPSEIKLLFPNDCALAKHELIGTLHDLVQVTASVIESFELLLSPSG